MSVLTQDEMAVSPSLYAAIKVLPHLPMHAGN